MKEFIKSILDQPAELEKLYRKNKASFKLEFNEVYPEIQGEPAAEFWHERLNFESESIAWGSIKDWQFVLISACFAYLIAKIPAFFSIPEDHFYPRNLGFIIFPFVSGYFLWKNNAPRNLWILLGGVLVLAAIYINLLPQNTESDTLVLACIHLPILLWSILGTSFSSGDIRNLSRRMAFLRFNGDAVVMGAILALSGGLLSGLTVGLFGLIGLNIEKVYFEWIGVFGLTAAPLVATHLTQTNPQLVNKVSPVVAKIFSPLVLVMLVIYLGAIVYSGKDPYNDREFLMLFNMLLIGVMALVFFSVAETSQGKNSHSGVWILLFLSLVTIVVNGIALSAIVFRISEWGLTPNRLAVLGVNILMLVHLLLVTNKLGQTARKTSKIEEVGDSIAKYLPVYFIWTAIVVFLFPLIFSFA